MNVFQKWLNEILQNWGIIGEDGQHLATLVLSLCIIFTALLLYYGCKKIILGVFSKIAIKTKTDWDDILLERKIPEKVIHLIPAIFIYIMIPLILTKEVYPILQPFATKICVIYIIAISLRFISSLLSLVSDLYHRKNKGKSIKGFVQVLQVIIIFIGVIIIIAQLIDKSPTTLLAGLGASAAILSLVFKDTLMGFVAGIQLTANDMLRPGDWITMEKYGADGTVIDVTLNAVKVRNFDNTIVTIPPYSLVSDSFQNWRGMSDSPGRRVKRSIWIDMNSVKFCSNKMLEKFQKINLLTEYIEKKEKELYTYNEEHHIDNSIVVNGRRQTNIGVFRAYLEQYLKNHPFVSKELTAMVRHLQPTEKGIPIELYFFLSEKRWVLYESIQADIFDHIMAVIPEFELEVFQAVSGSDLRSLKTETINEIK